jgi:PAS domain S-box-containing protein
MNRPLPGLLLASALLVSTTDTLALDPSREVSQYSHTSWTSRDGYALGAVFAITQTPDGYLWLGGEFGLFRFDGVSFTRWKPPAGQELPSQPYSLMVARDGTLWIGTFGGLASWNGTTLTRYPGLDDMFVTSLLEDRDGTVWAGTLSPGRLCEVRSARVQCHGAGEFGNHVWSLAEDATGALWAAAESGLWKWKPGPPRRREMPGMQLGDLITTADGRVLIGIRGAGLMQVSGERIEPYPLRAAGEPGEPLPDGVIRSNKLMRDRDGGLWIGTDGRGLLHVHDGRASTFSKADGLSGNIACSLFEDREGNIWFASASGLDRFREQTVTTVSVRQGLSNDTTKAVITAPDGSIWVATSDGVTRWRDDRITVFRKGSGFPDVGAQSLWSDPEGRVWAGSNLGLARFDGEKFVIVEGSPSREIYSMAGDADGIWLSGNAGLSRFRNGRFEATFPWISLGRTQQAKVAVPDAGGVWLSFWKDGGVSYFADGKVRESYTPAQGLGKGHVSGLRRDADGTLWAATEEGGLSRLKEGRIQTLTTENGLPCNAIHWSIEDRHRALWMNTACGLVRIPREDVDAWIADPSRKVRTTVWSTSDGFTPRAVSSAYFNPPAALAADGKLWFVAGEGVHIVDPDHLPFNATPPPVYIRHLTADRKPYAVVDGLRLPPLAHDVTIEFTALTYVDPTSVHFRYRLLGHDEQWQEIVDRREVTYANLPPGAYRFQVRASNNSGVWNETGAQLAFSITPAIYQTLWFRLACAALFVGIVWGAVQLRLRRLRRDEKRLRDVIEGIPVMAFSVHPDGSPDLVNQRWLEYTGLSSSISQDERGWGSAIHPDDVDAHVARWRTALARGEPFESEARHRSASGAYRWFLVQAVPLRDKNGRIVKWYGTLTDIEERKRAEAERERLRQLEAHLAHTNRLSMLGELTASLAHEINQPIGAVIASAGAGLRWLGRDPPELQRVHEAIVRIKDDGKRAADIIAGLKAFYKKGGPAQRAVLDINDVVREMLGLLHREAERHAVVMRTELGAGLPAVRADRVQLQQVLMNLMVNAFEAMGDRGGELVIRTQPRDGGLLVSVSDTGVGIPPDELEHVFSAFVTSKAKGTGMGLAISRTIVESHDGKLWAEARESGATFCFSLPAAAPPTGGVPDQPD